MLHKFELNDEDHDLLLLMMGYATGAAAKMRQDGLANRFLGLANTIEKDNPNYRPYEIPAFE
jgi:hypothetical protein